MQWAKQFSSRSGTISQGGFTIVELLIVIVVIAILAAITIVSYNGIQNRAKLSSLTSDVANGAKFLETYKTVNNDAFPATLSAAQTAGLKVSAGNTADYSYNANTKNYCLSVSNTITTYFISSVTNNPREGACGIVDGLVGWWPLDGDITDLSGYGNNGTFSGGAVSAPGQNGASGAFAFSTNPSCVTLPASTTKPYYLPSGTNLSITAWVKTSSTGGQVVIRNGIGSDEQYGLHVYSSGIRYEWYDGSVFPTVNSASGIIPSGTWSFISATRSSANSVLLYLNGTQVGTGTATATPNTAGALQLGSSASCGSNQIFQGSIDDVRVYNRVLSATELQSMYQVGAN